MTEDAVTRGWTDDLGRFRPYCKGTTKRGTECRATATHKGFCLTHDPLGNGLSPKQNAIREGAIREANSRTKEEVAAREQWANRTKEEAAALFPQPKRRRSRETAAKAAELVTAIDAMGECKGLSSGHRATLLAARRAVEAYL